MNVLDSGAAPCGVRGCSAAAQYQCPRCRLPYCSVRCYRGHSTRCVEDFHRAHLSGLLRGRILQGAEEREVAGAGTLLGLTGAPDRSWDGEEGNGEEGDGEEMDGLVEQEEEKDEEEVERLERLAERLEDGAGVQEVLAEMKRPWVEDFQRGLRDGRLAAMVELWTPWWQAGTGTSNDALVEERAATVSEAGRLLEAHRKASPLLQNGLLEVVYCYCTVMRLYNGDWTSDPLGAFAELCRLSAVLARDARYQSPAAALQRAMEGAAGLHSHLLELALGGVQDVLAVLKCPRGLQRVMRDAQRLAQSALEELKGREKRKAQRIHLKIGYFVSWSESGFADEMKGKLLEETEEFLRTRQKVVDGVKVAQALMKERAERPRNVVQSLG